MKKFFKTLSAVIIVIAIVMIGKSLLSKKETPAKPLTQEEIIAANFNTYEACKNDLLACIALVEGLHTKPYYDNVASWTIGYGSTFYPNGRHVTKKDQAISKEYAQQCVFAHCDECIWPWISKYVKRTLTPQQMIGTWSFIYNIGGEAFSGCKANGKRVADPSNFLTAINDGKSDSETAVCMNGFRKSNGKLAKGLPKRHWIEGALYMGLIKASDLYDLEPKKFYEKNQGFDLSFYYKSQNGPYWEHDYSDAKIKEFLQKNHSDTNNVRAIL